MSPSPGSRDQVLPSPFPCLVYAKWDLYVVKFRVSAWMGPPPTLVPVYVQSAIFTSLSSLLAGVRGCLPGLVHCNFPGVARLRLDAAGNPVWDAGRSPDITLVVVSGPEAYESGSSGAHVRNVVSSMYADLSVGAVPVGSPFHAAFVGGGDGSHFAVAALIDPSAPEVADPGADGDLRALDQYHVGAGSHRGYVTAHTRSFRPMRAMMVSVGDDGPEARFRVYYGPAHPSHPRNLV